MGAPPLGRLTWGTSAALVSPRQRAPPSARARGVPTRRQSPHPGCIPLPHLTPCSCARVRPHAPLFCVRLTAVPTLLFMLNSSALSAAYLHSIGRRRHSAVTQQPSTAHSSPSLGHHSLRRRGAQLGSASRSSWSNQISSHVSAAALSSAISLSTWSWTGFPSILTSRTLVEAWGLVMDTPAGVAFEADTEGVLGVQRVQKPFLTAM